MSDVCSTCRYCQPGTPWKGYCAKWDITVEYSESCKMHRKEDEVNEMGNRPDRPDRPKNEVTND